MSGGVQLWDGGPYWADRNIGAENPLDSGYYFWWGDTIGYKGGIFKWVTSDGSNSNFSFEFSNAPTHGKSTLELGNKGWITENGVLAPEHDAAQKHWGAIGECRQRKKWWDEAGRTLASGSPRARREYSW